MELARVLGFIHTTIRPYTGTVRYGTRVRYIRDKLSFEGWIVGGRTVERPAHGLDQNEDDSKIV